jgi:ribosomal protein S15P/S13E
MKDYASLITALGTSNLICTGVKDVHFGDLQAEASPGDHLMVKMPNDPICHEGIYYNHKYVIDNMPSGGVGLRKLTSFAPTGHERLVVVKYERDSEEELLRSLQRAEALKEFCKTNPHDFHSSYDVLLNNCQHFASLCRTGRCERIPDVIFGNPLLFPPSKLQQLLSHVQA